MLLFRLQYSTLQNRVVARRRVRRHAGVGVDQLDARREELRTTLPIGCVVGPDDTALTGATYDGGQQLV